MATINFDFKFQEPYYSYAFKYFYSLVIKVNEIE